MATAIPLTGAALKLNALHSFSKSLEHSEKMPVLFLGHGSPMNAIEENQFVQGFITPKDGGDDVFVHMTGLIDEVRENDNVTFDLENGRKGINAINVRVA